MDAFALFNKLWADSDNPFRYLLNLKDEHGTPLYEPHPSPVRYPLISVMRQGIRYRPYQNFSIHQWRHIGWPTVSDTGSAIPGKNQIGTDLLRCDLGNVVVSHMPMAFDYRFQIDHFCMRPDTQAFYLEKLMRQFWRTGGSLQTWMMADYPGYGQQYIRAYVDGEISNIPPDESAVAEHNVEFRTSYTLVIEGFDVDTAFQTVPALWTLIAIPAHPDQLNQLLQPVFTEDLRLKGHNVMLESRPNVPAAGTCADEGIVRRYLESGTFTIELSDLVGTLPGDNVISPNRFPVIKPIPALEEEMTFSFGIDSTLVLGVPSMMAGTQVPFWLSGTIFPAATGMAVEFSDYGTLLTDANGSYTGLFLWGYSGTATPHYASAQAFTPPYQVFTNLQSAPPSADFTWLPGAMNLGDPALLITTTFGTHSPIMPVPTAMHDAASLRAQAIGNYTRLPLPETVADPASHFVQAFGSYDLAAT